MAALLAAALLAAARRTGWPSTDCARVTIIDAAIADDAVALEEIFEPVEAGMIAGR